MDPTTLTPADVETMSPEEMRVALRYFVTMLPSWGVIKGQFKILDLPLELLFEIFRHCDFQKIWALALSCKRMYELIWGDDDSFFTRKNKAGGKRFAQVLSNGRYECVPPPGASITLSSNFLNNQLYEVYSGKRIGAVDPSGEYEVTSYLFSINAKKPSFKRIVLTPTTESETAISQDLKIFFTPSTSSNYWRGEGTIQIKKGKRYIAKINGPRSKWYLARRYDRSGNFIVKVGNEEGLINRIYTRNGVPDYEIGEKHEYPNGKIFSDITTLMKKEFVSIGGSFVQTSEWWTSTLYETIVRLEHVNGYEDIQEIISRYYPLSTSP